MIFTTLDLHIYSKYVPDSSDLHRRFRSKINHVVDSFSVRIPKKTRTNLFRKLNVSVSEEPTQRDEFYALEGIGGVALVDPNVASIYEAETQVAVDRSVMYLRDGIRIAGKYDHLFAEHLSKWEQMLSESSIEYDFDCGIARSQRSRRFRAETVIRITPSAYLYEVLIRDGKSRQIVQRTTVKTNECFWPFFRGLGFSKLLWEDDRYVVGLTAKDEEVFRFLFDPSAQSANLVVKPFPQ